MHAFGRKLGLISALLMLAFAGACKGFFVNPTLSSLAVGPTATIQTTQTVQMIATATFSDGTTSTSPSNLFWSSSATSVATISSSGLVTGVGEGTATITASSGSVSGTATVTVSPGNITSITVETQQGTTTGATITAGNSLQLAAKAVTPSGTIDVTNVVTWGFNPSTATGVSISQSPTGGNLTTTSAAAGQTITITATDPTTGTTNTNTFTVTIN